MIIFELQRPQTFGVAHCKTQKIPGSKDPRKYLYVTQKNCRNKLFVTVNAKNTACFLHVKKTTCNSYVFDSKQHRPCICQYFERLQKSEKKNATLICKFPH